MSVEAATPEPLTPVVLHVLLALGDGPLHGYGIMKRIEDESGRRMGPGTVYGALHRLAEAGWIEELPAPVDEGAKGGDPRRGNRFVLTVPGRTALEAEGRRLARLARLVDRLELRTDAGT